MRSRDSGVDAAVVCAIGARAVVECGKNGRSSVTATGVVELVLAALGVASRARVSSSRVDDNARTTAGSGSALAAGFVERATGCDPAEAGDAARSAEGAGFACELCPGELCPGELCPEGLCPEALVRDASADIADDGGIERAAGPVARKASSRFLRRLDMRGPHRARGGAKRVCGPSPMVNGRGPRISRRARILSASPLPGRRRRLQILAPCFVQVERSPASPS